MNRFLFLLLCFPVFLFPQNTFIHDGSNSSGIGVEYAAGSNGFSTLSGNTAFSIGGVLDLGLSFGTTDTVRNGQNSTDTSIGLVYNILPIRYKVYLFEIMGNIRGSYDYLISDSDYADSIHGTMEGQGFSIAAEGIVDFRLPVIDIVTLRAGYHARYVSHLFTTVGNDNGTPVNVTERQRNTEKGLLAGVYVDIPDVPIIGYEILFLDSSEHNDYIRHRLSVVIKSN